MGKTHRHPELLVVVGAQASSHPLAKAGGARTQIHSNIKNLARHASHQFGLGLGCDLQMQPPQDATR